MGSVVTSHSLKMEQEMIVSIYIAFSMSVGVATIEFQSKLLARNAVASGKKQI